MEHVAKFTCRHLAILENLKLPTASADELSPICTGNGGTDWYEEKRARLNVICEVAAESICHAVLCFSSPGGEVHLHRVPSSTPSPCLSEFEALEVLVLR